MKKNILYITPFTTLFFTSISIASSDFSIEKVSRDLIVFSQNDQQGLIVINENNSIVVDPMNQETTKNIQNFLASNGKPMISHIIYSHSHWDRISTGKATLNKDIEVIAQQECSLYLSNNNKDVLGPTIYFQDYFEISDGGKKIDLYYYGPSHGECMIVIHLVEENLLFIPDLLTYKRGKLSQ